MLRGAFLSLALGPLASICAFRIVTIALNARSWQLLLPPVARRSFGTLLRLRWIGESVNSLLPVAQVGGDLARARLVAARGVPPADAAASMIADMGTGIATQVIFGIGGALALVHARGYVAGAPRGRLILGLVAAALAALSCFALFRWGAVHAAARWLSSRTRGRSAELAGSLERLDGAVAAILAREADLAAAAAWHLAGWASQAVETWLVLAMLGVRISPVAALAIEAVAAAARGAAFFVPGGLGVQELTLVSLARSFGVDASAALTLAVAKRAREVVVGVPGLLAWSIEEKRLWRRRERHE